MNFKNQEKNMNILLSLFSCILAAALIFNLLWASSSSSFSQSSANWPLDKPHRLIFSNYTPNIDNIKVRYFFFVLTLYSIHDLMV